MNSLLQVSESNSIDPQSERISCTTLKSKSKCRTHASNIAIPNAYHGNFFSFSTDEKVDLRKNAGHDDKILVKIIFSSISSKRNIMILLSAESYRAAIGVFYLRLGKHVHTQKRIQQ